MDLPQSAFYPTKKQCKKCRFKVISKWRQQQRKIRFSNKWFSRRYEAKKRQAKQRALQFSLTKERFCALILGRKCSYCGIEEPIITIDRINNALGYTDSNCCIACNLCNSWKSDQFSAHEMKIIGIAIRKVKLLRAKESPVPHK